MGVVAIKSFFGKPESCADSWRICNVICLCSEVVINVVHDWNNMRKVGRCSWKELCGMFQSLWVIISTVNVEAPTGAYLSSPRVALPHTINTSLSCFTTVHSSSVSSSSCESFARFAVNFATGTQYSRTKTSILYVEFHLVVTSWGIMCSDISVSATHAFQAGRRRVVELMILNASLRIWVNV